MLTVNQLAKAGYPKHARAVAWARKHVGEGEHPAGSNTGSFVELCQRATWLAGTRWAWCRAFNLRAHKEAGFDLPDGSAGAWDALDRARTRGDALDRGDYDRAIPGDEVIWTFGSGHSSLLTGFTTRNGVVYVDSVDGNVHDQVAVCERPLSLVKGFVVWHESPPPPAAKKPAQKAAPKRQVVGSISGRRQLVTKKGHVIPLPKRKAGPAGTGLGHATARASANFPGAGPPPRAV